MIFRGAIYEIKALPGTRGHEQQDKRFAVIIQSGRFPASTVIVALTSTSASGRLSTGDRIRRQPHPRIDRSDLYRCSGAARGFQGQPGRCRARGFGSGF
ncbi:type II toxin-antitoxin system PemK/MazF family toxin [Nocardia sp. R6R-6]|uniref:type II toxin-antitoxin system PemK/MazF family toxin n=1 Tax=Nocardia sp. R6R-6 TaxID=3459303 RepID=UPI00403E0440